MKKLIKNLFNYFFIIFSLPLIFIVETLEVCGLTFIEKSYLVNKRLSKEFIRSDSTTYKYPNKHFVSASFIISPFLWLGIIGIFKLL